MKSKHGRLGSGNPVFQAEAAGFLKSLLWPACGGKSKRMNEKFIALVNKYTIKPIDREWILKYAVKCNIIFNRIKWRSGLRISAWRRSVYRTDSASPESQKSFL
jgi:hypothetical protein